MKDLTDKVAIVTGGAGGIGKAVVEALLNRGAKVSICDIKYEECKAFADELKKKHGDKTVLPLQLDVTQVDSFRDVMSQTRKILGVVDIMINNAAIYNEQNYVKTVDTNLVGVFRGTELAMAEIAEAGKKSSVVINVSSVPNIVTSTTSPYYFSTKAAINSFTRYIGDEYHYSETGVRVMCLCPKAVVDTPLMHSWELYPFNDRTLDTLRKRYTGSEKMRPSEVADALLKLIDKGKSGDIAVKKMGMEMFYLEESSI